MAKKDVHPLNSSFRAVACWWWSPAAAGGGGGGCGGSCGGSGGGDSGANGCGHCCGGGPVAILIITARMVIILNRTYNGNIDDNHIDNDNAKKEE